MVLDNKETTVAYRCPNCGQTVVGMVGIFSLSGDMIRLKCSCGQSELLITYTPDRKIQITAPCLVCQTPHRYTLGSSSFFSDRVITFSCPMTGLELCFVGKKDQVLSEASSADRHLLELMDEAGLQSLDEIKASEDPQSNEDLYFISDVIQFLLAELQADNAVRCRCEDPGQRDIHFRFVTDRDEQKVEIYCAKCGASALFPIVSANDANAFLTVDTLELL